MADVAYKPISDTAPPTRTDFIQQIPPYEDVGVEYKGYSKTLLSGNSYKLNPQEREIIHLSGTISTGTLQESITNKKKTFYCTKIVFSVAYLGTPFLVFNVFDSSELKFSVSTTDSVIDLNFKVPLRFDFNLLFTFIGATGTDFVNVTAYGWLE